MGQELEGGVARGTAAKGNAADGGALSAPLPTVLGRAGGDLRAIEPAGGGFKEGGRGMEPDVGAAEQSQANKRLWGEAGDCEDSTPMKTRAR